MLKENLPNIKVFKMCSGEEIITKVSGVTDNEFIVENPLQLTPGPNGLQFAPYLLMAQQDKSFLLSRSAIAASANPSLEVENQYESVTTGIALPKKSSIITQ